MIKSKSNADPNFDEDWNFDKDWPKKFKWKCSLDEPCERLTCEVCSAPPRLRWIRRTLAITEAHPGQCEIATIVLLPIPMFLGSLEAKILRGILRDIFERVNFQGARLRGGFDVIWGSSEDDWILCAHVLAIDVPPGAWARLRAFLRNAKPKWPNNLDASYFRPNFLVNVQRLHDPETQIANLMNLHTYFWPRPGAAGSPAPANHLEALTDWGSNYTFKDLIFRFRM
jgi:hypothetical protein